MDWVQNTLKELENTPRVEMSVKDLVIGAECGGSDYTSGLAGNVVVGRFYDWLVDQGGTAIFEGKRRHHVIHLKEHVVVKTNDRRTAFPERHIAPGIALKRHEATVPELTPFFIVDEFRIPCLRREVKLEQTAAFARRLHRRHGCALATLCANEFHQKPPSKKLFQFSFCPFYAVPERHPSRRKASLWPNLISALQAQSSL